MLGNPQHTISTKEFISQTDYNEIKQLQEICLAKEEINLKLELDYKLHMSKSAIENSKSTNKQSNDFLYYIEDTLVAYIGINCFGGNIGEVNGMTHPDWRRRGIFHKLFDRIIEECMSRDYSKILLLSDDNSASGNAFIKSIGGIYDFSEYRMKRVRRTEPIEASSISLRIAQKQDKKNIAMLNVKIFDDKEDDDNENLVVLDDPNTTIYMVELSNEIIGKIHVEYSANSAFIFGFGILPDYRRKGYGRATLNELLRLIEEININEVSLDVVCTNKNALNLYISCGFQQQSIMNYYQYHINID